MDADAIRREAQKSQRGDFDVKLTQLVIQAEIAAQLAELNDFLKWAKDTIIKQMEKEGDS